MIDILASLNLLLRRPWVNGLDGLTSSLHQKIKFIIDENKVIKLRGYSWIRATKTSSSAPILEVQLLEHGVTNMQGFEFVNMINDEPL